jgi:hypothetical protein
MALVRCPECGRDVSDKADNCPGCGAPVDAASAIAVPETLTFENGAFVGTSQMIADLAKKSIERLNYKVDSASVADRTVSFTTGMTMGSFSGVSGTISWQEDAPHRFTVTGGAKQNVRGGQVMALNLFDEADGKVRNVIGEMTRLAQGGSESEPAAGGCVVLLLGLSGAALAGGGLLGHFT